MIESLTDEQTALFPVYVDKWTKIGLSCEPVRISRAKVAVHAAYTAAGLPPPKHVVLCGSPISGAIVAAILKTAIELRGVRTAVADALGVTPTKATKATKARKQKSDPKS